MDDTAKEVLRHLREFWAENFERFDPETNKALLCLDNEAAFALGETDE